MNLTYIIGIEIRSHLSHVLDGVLEITRKHHIVVVVSDCMEDGQVFDELNIVQVLGELIILVVPVIVPRHVTEGHGIDFFRFVFMNVRINLLAELSEPLTVVVPAAGKVHITEDKHFVIGLVSSFEYAEVNPFRS